MAILLSREIKNAVVRELRGATKSVQIITAYCKMNTFEYLNSEINPSVIEKRLLVRFRMDDIVQGSTDFDILEYGLQTGWKVFIRFDLHAKTYIVDNKRGFVGSANATNSGLNNGRLGNMEMATLVDVEKGDVRKIEKLYEDAIPVDYNLVGKLKEQIGKINNNVDNIFYKWDLSILSKFKPHIDTLFSHELPDDFCLKKGEYFSFLDYTYLGNKDELKEVFRWSNSYIWLCTILKENNGCLYFGEISEKLHNALISDPKPFRRDVKHMLANLLKLIEELSMDEILVDRPNYSQRVRLIDKL